MTKDELTQAFLQLSRGFPQVAEQLAEHFMPEPVVEAPAPAPAPAAPTVSVPVPAADGEPKVPHPSAETIDAMKAADGEPKAG